MFVFDIINLVTCFYTPYYAFYLPVMMNLKLRNKLNLQSFWKKVFPMMLIGIFFGGVMIICWIYSFINLINKNIFF